jgi:hypothetical protein
MTETDIARVRDIACRFRDALETHAAESAHPGLRNFPRDSCADAVLLLGAYLLDAGLGTFEAVGGRFATPGAGESRTHAWLDRDGVIVDITADQFPDVTEKVIVTRDPAWHRRFHSNNRGVADFRRYDPATAAQLGAVYERVCQTLDSPLH